MTVFYLSEFVSRLELLKDRILKIKQPDVSLFFQQMGGIV